MSASTARNRSRGFTLTELLVAIAIIGILAAITVVAIRGISKDAKLASGKNTVMAVLDNARARAIKDNRIVIVVFRPRLVDDNKQIVEAVFAEWTGESYLNTGTFNPVIDRFVPMPDVPARRFPPGIKVAGPSYGTDEDDLWATQVHLPGVDQTTGTGEVSGAMIGVMFGGDGTTISRNPQSDSNRSWIDFNNDFLVQAGGAEVAPEDDSVAIYFDQRLEFDEPCVTIAPFIAVFDDVEARELSGDDWSNSGVGQANYLNELIGTSGYITTYADRIHFNRYTGVAMK